MIADNEILYVGISNNLDRRLYQHWENDVQFSHVFCFGGIPDNFLTEVECFYIHALDPPLNIKIPPKGEVAGEYLKRLRKGTLRYTYV